MKLALRLCLGLVPLAVVWSQPLSVYSEFARIDASGEVAAPEMPREILSPALVRNGFTSFQVVVQAPADTPWWMYVGQNPPSAVKVTLYRESGGNGEPEEVELPRRGQGTEILWMDVWTGGDAPVGRIKIEPAVHLGLEQDDDWVTYPIEGRVVEARVPGPALLTGRYLCPLAALPVVSTSRFHLRNGAQDFALAAQVPKDQMAKLQAFCDAPAPERWSENYLRIRDYLFGLR